MERFNVLLTKSYQIEIIAANEEQAKNLAEFFTSNITDISSEQDKLQHNFSIESIECTLNEAFDCEILNNL